MYQNILTIGGLFCRTGEGLNRDVRTIVETGNRARPIITTIDPSGDDSINKETTHFIPQNVIVDQVVHSFKTWPIKAVKTGYIGKADTMEEVAAIIAEKKKEKDFPLIVDPSLLGSDGRRNIGHAGLNILKRDLILIADLMIPSVREAELLTGMEIKDVNDMAKAAEMLLTLGAKAVFIRGGNFKESDVIDMLATDSTTITFEQPRLMITGISGARGYGGVLGCVIASRLADGLPYKKAIDEALSHVKGTFLSDL